MNPDQQPNLPPVGGGVSAPGVPPPTELPLPPQNGPTDPGHTNGYHSPLHNDPTALGQPPLGQMAPPAVPNQPTGQAQGPAQIAPPKASPNSTQNSLQIAEVRDGLVIMNDGSFRTVVMVKSINFDLMSPQEREAVEFSYQNFLNSLYFPVQIFVHSRKVDLGPYIEKLDKIRTEHENMLLALLMEDYINFMDQLALRTNIMDKKFYIVIPFFPVADVQQATLAASKGLFTGLASLINNKQAHVTVNETDLNKAKDELKNRVQAVLGGLLQCGIQGLPLDTQELIELYYDVYNPDTATRQELKNFNDMNVPVVTKGQGQAPQPNLDKELL